MAKKRQTGLLTEDSHFKSAVKETPDIADSYKAGIGAIKGSDRDKIKFTDNRLVGGSVEIDEEYHRKHPQDKSNRWDYVISYNKKTLYIEIHPVSPGEAKVVINKLEWLKKWLKESAPKLDKIDKHNPAYYWVATKAGFNLLKTSKEYKAIRLKKIEVTNHFKM